MKDTYIPELACIMFVLGMVGFAMLAQGCTTTYTEFQGECVTQQWKLASVVMRQRQICDLPMPDEDEMQVRDRDKMNPNPFPGLWDQNPADTADPNLLEKRMLIQKMNRTKDPAVIDELMRQYKALEEE